MWGSDGRASGRIPTQGMTAPARADAWGADVARLRADRRNEQDPLTDVPDPDDGSEFDTAELDEVEDGEDEAAELIRSDSRGSGGSGGTSATDPLWLRIQARKLLREFLRAVPRNEPQVMIAFIHPDGTPRTVTRGQLATAIDRMRPRLRQIMRLSVEERWPRQRVCEYLRHISIKTFERDQAEGLDALIDGEFQGY